MQGLIFPGIPKEAEPIGSVSFFVHLLYRSRISAAAAAVGSSFLRIVEIQPGTPAPADTALPGPGTPHACRSTAATCSGGT